MRRQAVPLSILIAGLALTIGVIGWVADWTASDFTRALLIVSGLTLFATLATLGGGGSASSGGAMTDPIARGRIVSGGGILAGVPGAAVDDSVTDGDEIPAPTPRGSNAFLPMLGIALASGAAALMSWMVFE